MRRVQGDLHQEDRHTRRRVHLAKERESQCWDSASGSHFTKSGQVVLKVISEMIALPRGFIVELNVHDVVGILVGRFDHANHIKSYSRNESSRVGSVDRLHTHLSTSVYLP